MKHSLKFILIFLATIASSSAYACSCIQVDLADRFNDSQSVFTAKLSSAKAFTLSDKREMPYVEGIFKVIEIYKGNPTEEIKLKTGMGGGDCGIQMSFARKYIIFKGSNDYIGICGGSTTINPYDEDELAKKLRRLGAKATSNEAKSARGQVLNIE